ncbi:MAG: metalloregulator ArsR/SmtB family transcription factor [Spirochaeta sp.]|jgi:ArsR family transcriptional regulator|nr:metalloregulator ArsR/SmtB family transcription factor [Spirochaeta sp.]
MSTIDVLKALSDETRIRMVNLVAVARDLCACEIETVLGVNQSNASRHLNRLKTAGVFTAERRGLWVHYHPSSAPEVGRIVHPILEAARTDLSELAADLERLTDYRASGYTCETIGEWKVAETTRQQATRISVQTMPR